MRQLFILILSIFVFNFGYTQKFSNCYGDYLGLILPKDTPVVFAPEIISKNTLEHSAAIFSTTGNIVYWCSGANPYLKFMTKINNKWTEPQNFIFNNDSVNWIDPFLSNDGKRLYFSATRNKIIISINDTSDKNIDLWYIDKINDKWSFPKSLSSIINTEDGQCQISVSNCGDIYYSNFSIKNNNWKWNIMHSQYKDGKYITPDTVPLFQDSNIANIANWTPYIAPENSYLIFASNKEGGNLDLYISFKNNKLDKWSTPINMGDLINTKYQESYPTVSPDGKFLFFTRFNKKKSMDIFWVSTSIINRLRNEQQK